MRYTFGTVEDLLLEQGTITAEQRDHLREREVRESRPLPDLVEEMGLLGRSELWDVISERMGVPWTPLTPDMIRPEAVAMLDEGLARKYCAVPVMMLANILTVAMVDPQDLFVVDTLRTACKHRINPILCSPEDIRACLDHYYGPGVSLALDQVRAPRTDDKQFTYIENVQGGLDPTEDEVRAPGFSVSTLVDRMISEAYNLRASDIHVECARDFTRIRYRVDGDLREAHRWPRPLQAPVLSRLKVLSLLDITRHMTPQDGHFSLQFKDLEVDFRVATIPTERGENCVIRILDQSRGRVHLGDVGFHADDLASLRKALACAQGFILMTGPTGSGKTTTLYAMLNEINSVDKKIITIEDPVEYRLDLVNQIPVTPRVGLTFAAGLRSILRSDPDVVLVGEIRDLETAQIAVQASLTGHLLLSTLHTSSTVETVYRLLDIGIEPYFVKEVLNCVVAQRLVKTLCPYCREQTEPAPSLLEDLGLAPGRVEGHDVFRPAGCHFCGKTGFRGRTAITEVMMGTDEVRQGIMKGMGAAELHRAAVYSGMRPFIDNALDKVFEGVTTLEEVRRVMPAAYTRPLP